MGKGPVAFTFVQRLWVGKDQQGTSEEERSPMVMEEGRSSRSKGTDGTGSSKDVLDIGTEVLGAKS